MDNQLVVEQFLKARCDGRGAEAAALLHPKASLGTVWGYHTGEKNCTNFLVDEQRFYNREYVERQFALKKIDDNTYMRKFHFYRNVREWTDAPRWLWTHKWRETFFVKDGKIDFVHVSRQPAGIFDVLPFLFPSLYPHGW